MPGIVKLSDKSLKVANQFESEEFKSYLNLMRDWYNKGYIRKDAATLADAQPDRKAGKNASLNAGNIGPDNPDAPAKIGDLPAYVAKTTQPYLLTSSIIATMTGVSKTSKNPERAVMFLDLLFKDKQLYNILAHGIEGKHYKLTNGAKEVIKEGGYDPQFDWEIGNSNNSLTVKQAYADLVGKNNQSALGSPLLGFTFNPDPVKTEMAQVATVTVQYIPLLETGSADTAKVLPEFIDKLKKAGSDKIIAEEQKQIDEWKKANGK
ncbi:MAG: ABC transporter substrate-binding protein [Paenibacillaceae bacterium]|nr:ABC transporter substrate-binding protein [Paenibacillaceae bacterium]